jgi:hypothetical protein
MPLCLERTAKENEELQGAGGFCSGVEGSPFRCWKACGGI